MIRAPWRGGWAAVLALPPTAFLLLFFAYPVLTLFAFSLAPGGTLDLSAFVTLATNPVFGRVFGFTLAQAAASTGLTLLFALPVAAAFVRYRFPGKRLVLALSALPFVLPAVVVAPAFLTLLGDRGLINQWLIGALGVQAAPLQIERSLTIILLAHVFYNFPLALRLIYTYWAGQPPNLEQAARTHGLSGWQLWRRVRWPLLRPAITGAALLVFVFCFTSFGVIVLLGGARFATVEVEIVRQATTLFNLPLAAALSIGQMMLIGLVLAAYGRLQRRAPAPGLPQRGAPPRRFIERVQLGLALGFIVGVLFAPLLALVASAFTFPDGALTLRHFTTLNSNPRGSVLFVPPMQAIGNSLAFALATTALAVPLGLLSAYAMRAGAVLARWLEPLIMLPLATSAVTIGFGTLIALDEPPLNLRSSALLIPIVHTLVALPLVMRSILPAVRALPENTRAAARLMGVTGWAQWRQLDLPLIAPSLGVAAAFAFTASMGEFGASLFIARPDAPTLPIAIYRLLGQPGGASYGQALALSAILLAVCALAFGLIAWLTDRQAA